MLDNINLWTALCHLGFNRSTPRSRADRDVVLFGLNREDKADTSIISLLRSSITPRWFFTIIINSDFIIYRWLAKMFKSADDNKDGGLSFDECLTLLKQMNVKLRKSYARKLFNVRVNLSVFWGHDKS
jgi:hypothetical protein